MEHVNEVFVRERLIGDHDINLEQSIEEMEKLSPLVKFNYSNGKPAVIMACRNFMYYGSKGDSFESFRWNVLDILSSGLLQITEKSRNLE